jgi:hypothetical protein
MLGYRVLLTTERRIEKFYNLLNKFCIIYSEVRNSQLIITLMLVSLLNLWEGISNINYQVYASDDDNSDDNNDGCSITNVILGTRSYTRGTECDDTIIGAPVATVSGGVGSIYRELEFSKNEFYGNGAPRFLVDSTFLSSCADVTSTLFSSPWVSEFILEHNILIGNQ